MTTVLISGGSGLIGRHLSLKLIEKGYHVAILSRTGKQHSKNPTYAWDPTKGEIDKAALSNAAYIIHLAGVNIGEKRWTPARKKLIIDSRVQSAQLIFKNLPENNPQLKAFITASAIGYYGSITTDKIFDESENAADDFLGETCRKWENAADQFEKSGIRTVKIRTGLVLTDKGGALEKMALPVKLGIGSALGNGKQYMPWIHINDLCNIYIKAIEDDKMKGAYNAVAPDYKTNSEFTAILAKVLNKPMWFPNVPSFLLKIIFGKMSEIFLKGSRVSSEKIINSGFHFRFPELEKALKYLTGKD